MNIYKLIVIITLIHVTNNANAALLERLGGLAYYDTESDLTWLADAGGDIFENNFLSWEESNTWAENLSISGVTGWRLPTTLQLDPSCQGDVLSEGAINCTGSEMGNLFYNVFDKVAGFENRLIFQQLPLLKKEHMI